MKNKKIIDGVNNPLNKLLMKRKSYAYDEK